VNKGVLLDLDKPRRLRYDLSALADIEEKMGIDSVYEFFEKPLNFRTIRTVVWAGLLHEDPTLTEQDVGRMVDGENYQVVYDATLQALASAFPQGNGSAPNPMNPPTGGSTGEDSSG
jgi:hypothetical protein